MDRNTFNAEIENLKEGIRKLTPEHRERLLLHWADDYAHFLDEQWCSSEEALQLLRADIEEVR